MNRRASTPEDPEVTFASKMGALLEVAAGLFKAGKPDEAIEFLANAVELCEENPTYAVRRSDQLGSTLEQVVRGFVANALAKRDGHATLRELLARMDAVRRSAIH
jgi:hypothetical protein